MPKVIDPVDVDVTEIVAAQIARKRRVAARVAKAELAFVGLLLLAAVWVGLMHA